MSTSKQFNRQIEFLSTQPIIGNSGGAVYIAGGLNVSNLNVSNNVTIANLTITNNLFTSTGSTLLSSQWINVPAGISYTSANSNIGIGTTSPGFNLDVSGGARITSGLTVGTLTTIIGASIPNLLSSVITTGSILATNFINSTNITTVNLVANFTSLGNLTSSTGTFANKVGGSQTVGTLVVTTSASLIGNTNTIGSIFTTGGNVGINTTSPGFTLDVNGTLRISNSLTTGNVYSNNITSSNIVGTNISSAILSTSNLNASNYIAVGTSSPNVVLSTGAFGGNQKIAVFDGVSNFYGFGVNNNYLQFHSGSTTGAFGQVVLGNNGRFGIGTTSPSFLLDVAGSANILTSLTTSNVYSTNTVVTNNTLTNLISTNTSTGTLNSINLLSTSNTLTNLIYTNATGTSLNLSGLSSTNLTTTNFTTSNLNTTFATITNLNTITATIPNVIHTNITTTSILSTGPSNLIFNSNTLGSLFTTGGNVGINTTNPAFTLYITGTTRISSSLLATFNSNTLGSLFTSGGNVSITGNLSAIGLNTNSFSPAHTFINTGTNNPTGLAALTPNVPSGSSSTFYVGQSLSYGNAAQLAFNYNSNNSTSNSVQLSYYGGGSFVQLLNNGNIGINTLVPTNSLSINGNMNINCTTASLFNSSNTQKLVVSGDASGTFASDSGQLIVCGTTDQTKRLGLMIDTTNNIGIIQAGRSSVGVYPLCLNAAGGNIGINTSTPAFNLDVSGNGRFNGNGLAINNVSSPYTNSENSNNAFQIYSSSSTATVSLYMGTDATNNISWIQCSKSGTMLPICINPRGLPNAYLGIGTPAPLYPLHVVGSATNTVTGGYYFYANSGTALIQWSTSPQAIGIFATSAILTQNNFLASSDLRIKNICDEEINLDLIDLINPLIYTYKDRIKNPKKNIGFIAQNVFEHCPEAVTLHKGIIPDIMKLVDIIEIKDTIITIKNEWQLKEKDVIKIMVDDKDTVGELIDVIYADKDIIKFKHLKLKEKVFVYGRQVEDFHELNYDYVFTLGFAGIQKSRKEIKELKQQINKLTEFIKLKFQDEF